MSRARILFMVLIFCIPIGIVGYQEYQACRMLARQWHTQVYVPTDGRIISADVISTEGSKYTHYHAAFTYKYSVDGLQFTAHRYRYGGSPTDSQSANQIVAAHPAGSTVQVYYDPANPAETVLSPGVMARDVGRLFLPIALILFFLFGIIRTCGNARWSEGPVPVAGGIQIFSGMTAVRARLPRISPLTFGFVPAIVLTFLAPLFIHDTSRYPPATQALIALAVIVGTGTLAWAWQYGQIVSGRQDLVINLTGRTVQLPLTYNRWTRRELPFSDIICVALDEVRHSSKNGRVFYTYVPILQCRNGVSEKLANLPKERADSFVAWLREKLAHAK